MRPACLPPHPAVAYLRLVRPMRSVLRLAFVLLLSGCSAESWEAKSKHESEEFYGAKYVSVSAAEEERLLRGAIDAQRTGICNIHHIRMQKKQVPIYFGLAMSNDPYYSAELVYFPNAQEHVEGGCEYDPVRAKQRHYIFVCPQCKRAQRQWAIAHPRDLRAKEILAQRYGPLVGGIQDRTLYLTDYSPRQVLTK